MRRSGRIRVRDDMTTTELIELLIQNEKGGISHKSREISLTINGKYMPNPQITLSSTGDGIAGPEIDLDIDGEFFEEQEPKTEWIPVSERLPEDRREVLVTAYWHETYQVMMGSYYGNGLWWCVPFNNCGEHMQRLNPKAWMPLPKAYEPQESENKT